MNMIQGLLGRTPKASASHGQANETGAGLAVPRLFGRGERGQSMVEIGFVLPFLLVVVIGVVEVADSLNSYITLVDAARDGARLGSKNLATDQQIKNLILTETDRLRDDIDPAGDITIHHTTLDGVPAINVEVCNDRSLIMNIPLVMPETHRMCSETTMRVLPGQT
jgi:hypothetical protein